MKKYLSAHEAADELGVHERTVRRWIAAGILAAVRPGTGKSRFRIAIEVWQRFLERGKKP